MSWLTKDSGPQTNIEDKREACLDSPRANKPMKASSPAESSENGFELFDAYENKLKIKNAVARI